MTLTPGLRTPARPGVYTAPPAAVTGLRPERLDVAGFVGVALRGPVDRPVRIARWSEFDQLFGGFERPRAGPERLLPYAVAAFFRQGGQLAYVLRVAPHGRDADVDRAATATFRLPLPEAPAGPLLAAANEGEWGSALTVTLRYDVTQRVTADVEAPRLLRLPAGARVHPGSLLRLRDAVTLPTGAVRWVETVDERPTRGSALRVVLDRPLAVPAGATVSLAVVTGALDIDDRSAPERAGERLTGLGLSPRHPRYVMEVLSSERHLVTPLGDWSTVDLSPSAALSPVVAELVTEGVDRSPLIDHHSFFDVGAADADPLDEQPHVGVDRMGRVRELGLLCVPDLTWRSSPSPPAPPPTLRRAARDARCDPCDGELPEPVLEAPAPPPRGLDAGLPDDLLEIETRQRRAVDVARARRRFVLLLDVPDGLSAPQVTRWRTVFDTSYAAAYHPWLSVAHPGDGRAVPVPPSAFAAGIIAQRERRLGLPWGPANELATDAVRAEAVVTDAIHDHLHELGVNVFRVERDGFRLTAGRTLSSDPDYRQLSVRRLMTMLRLSLESQTQWLAFEPNTAELRERLARLLTGYLRTLNRQGAFAGRTEAESFFVRCGDELNPRSSVDRGRLVAELGVAPSTPLEYVLVRIARDVDGSLSVVTDAG